MRSMLFSAKGIVALIFFCFLPVLVGTGDLLAIDQVDQIGQAEYAPDELLVKFTETASRPDIKELKSNLGLETLKIFKRTKINLLKIRSGRTVSQVIEALRSNAFVEYVEPNYVRFLQAIPTDPDYSELWGLDNRRQTGGTQGADISAPDAWDIQTGSHSVVVAVIDSGVDWTHEDLAANIWTNTGEIPDNGIDDDSNGYVDDVHGWDFRDNDNDPADDALVCGGHGTHVAGIIGAVGDNGVGVVGVNWQVQIMPLRSFGTNQQHRCSSLDSDVIKAIEYAASFGVQISNNSYGGGPFSLAFRNAIRMSHSLFVASAGNEGIDNDVRPQYPASYKLSNIVSVAATDQDDELLPFSNYGFHSVDLGAPGYEILSTVPGNRYELASGTSMSTPYVTGVAALLLASDPTLTINDIKWRLVRGVDKVGLSVLTGGRLNASRSLSMKSDVVVRVVSLGIDEVFPGGTIEFEEQVTNQGKTSKTVRIGGVVIHADGSKTAIFERKGVLLAAGKTVINRVKVMAPKDTPTRHFGKSWFVGKVSTASMDVSDEDELSYTVSPPR